MHRKGHKVPSSHQAFTSRRAYGQVAGAQAPGSPAAIPNGPAPFAPAGSTKGLPMFGGHQFSSQRRVVKRSGRERPNR